MRRRTRRKGTPGPRSHRKTNKRIKKKRRKKNYLVLLHDTAHEEDDVHGSLSIQEVHQHANHAVKLCRIHERKGQSKIVSRRDEEGERDREKHRQTDRGAAIRRARCDGRVKEAARSVPETRLLQAQTAYHDVRRCPANVMKKTIFLPQVEHSTSKATKS